MRNTARDQAKHRPTAFLGTWALATSHLEQWAKLGALWLLFLLCVMQPVHLTQEVHALLPASAQHHAAIHCEEAREGSCAQPDDDVSKPLTGLEHERHHEAKCTTDSQLTLSGIEIGNGAPSQWDTFVLDFVPALPGLYLEVPSSPKKSRAPPLSERAPKFPSHSFQSGRSPPLGA